VANILKLLNWNFELGDNGDWTFGGLGAGDGTIQTGTVYSGAYALQLLHTETPMANQSAQCAAVTTVATADYTLRFWLRTYEATDGMQLYVYHYPNGYPGAPFVVDIISAADLVAEAWTEMEYTLTPLTTTDVVLFYTWHTSPVDVHEDPQTWHIDNVEYDDGVDTVAVKLAERGVQALISLLQTDLPTELAAIDSDRGDSLTLAVPANGDYFNGPAVIESGRTSIEIWEDTIEFANPYTDSGDGRAVYDLPVKIRVTWYNRDQDTIDQMRTRGRRYSAGVFNVVSVSPSLDDSDEYTVIASIDNVQPSWTLEQLSDTKFKGQVTISATVRCEEVQ
jgi:hypothetical protein